MIRPPHRHGYQGCPDAASVRGHGPFQLVRGIGNKAFFYLRYSINFIKQHIDIINFSKNSLVKYLRNINKKGQLMLPFFVGVVKPRE